MGARKRTLTPAEFAEAVGQPLEHFSHRCHEASLAIVCSGLFPKARVARGWAVGVVGQHSWVVLGDDVYSPVAWILDPTRWSYTNTRPRIEHGRNLTLHKPHGLGHWTQGRVPEHGGGPSIGLATRPRGAAWSFLQTLGPLDARGWAMLASLPVGGWPAREIIEAMLDTPALAPLVPIDVAGMLTDRNPGGLYLPQREEVAS